MAFVPDNGNQASPTSAIQVSSISTVTSGLLPNGTIVRDVSDNALYLISNDWSQADAASTPIAMGGNALVKSSTDVAPLILTPTDNVGFVVATGLAHQVLLPDVTLSKGRTIRIVAPTGAAGNITVKGFGADLINVANTYLIDANFEQASLTSDGVIWYAAASVP